MGFRRNHKTLQLTFTGELEGLEVCTRRATPAMMRQIVGLAEGAESGKTARSTTEQARHLLDLCDTFGELLESWNYEDEQGRPIPATAEALASEDTTFVLALVYGWLDAVAIRSEQLSPPPDKEIESTLPVEALG